MEKNTFPNIPNEIRLDSDESIRAFHEECRTRKVIVDMGCGHGDYLIEHCPNQPDALFIGVEIARKRVSKTSERLHKRGFTNYRVVHASGDIALAMLFPEGSIDELHVNFPGPWLRKRQWKNRILRPSFVMLAARALKKGGKLHFVTDVEEYALHASSVLAEYPMLKSIYPNLVEKNLFESFPTLFYRKMSPLRSINYSCFEKHEY